MMNLDNRLMLNATMKYAPDASVQLKQPEIAQGFLAAHQIKEQQQKADGKVASVEKQEHSETIHNDLEGESAGAYYESSGEREGEGEEQEQPTVALGRRIKSRAPNNPFRFDVSI